MNTHSITTRWPSLTRSLSDSWLFHLGDLPESWQKDADEADFIPVHVPHDWSVSCPFSEQYSSGTGYVAGGIGWYRCHFALSDEWQNLLHDGCRLFLHFDGVYKHARTWVNSCYKGAHACGYTPFTYDITEDVLKEGDNVISVYVDHRDIADSRWFTGSGLTRKVTLSVKGPVRCTEYGIFFHTVTLLPETHNAAFEVTADLCNDTHKAQCVLITHTLLNKEDKEVASLCRSAVIPAKGSIQVSAGAELAAVRPWSPQDPYLYTLITTLRRKDAEGSEEILCQETNRTGIRSEHFDADRGFYLNGRNIKLRGVCVHDDCGALGAAAAKETWYPRLLLLKEAGCNAIRMSHNPHMPELYDLCDEMGFLVMDEAFDEWEGPKNKWRTGHNVYPPGHEGYWLDFPQHHEEDLRAMILRDRNHPSVILWSIGNEIDYPNDPYCHPSFKEMVGNNDSGKPAAEFMYNPARPNAERLAGLASMLAGKVRAIDTTHPLTLAAAFPELSSRLGFLDELDVAGYNYKEFLYKESHSRFPALPFIGSENSPRYEDWKIVRDNDYISGQFIWTGVDYLGEAHGWPVRASGAGLLTLAGFPKPGYYRRMSFWSTSPMAHLVCMRTDDSSEDSEAWRQPLLETWNFLPGESIDVVCYTNLSTAELFVNGKSCGARDKSDDEDCIRWRIPFEEGQLFVHASGRLTCAPDGISNPVKTDDENGLLTASAGIETVQAPAALKVTTVQVPEEFRGQGQHIEQLDVHVLDPKGRLVPSGDVPVQVQVENGTLLGIESGDIADVTPYYESVRRTCCGHLRIYIRKNCAHKDALVRVSSKGLAPDIARI